MGFPTTTERVEEYILLLDELKRVFSSKTITKAEKRSYNGDVFLWEHGTNAKEVLASPRSVELPNSKADSILQININSAVVKSERLICSLNGAIIPAAAKELKANGYELEVCTVGKKKVYVSIECETYSLVIWQSRTLMEPVGQKALFDAGVQVLLNGEREERPSFFNRLKAALVLLF